MSPQTELWRGPPPVARFPIGFSAHLARVGNSQQVGARERATYTAVVPEHREPDCERACERERRWKRRGNPLRRSLCVVLLAALPLSLSCKTSRAGQGQGGSSLVDPSEVPDRLREQWQALVDARAGDPSAPEVEEAADAVLDRAPPVALRVGALAAKAERRYLTGDDTGAILLVDEALALSTDDPGGGVGPRTALHRTLALALVRSGDPERALTILEGLEQSGAMDQISLRGARAVALDRSGDTPGALAGFVAWRELLDDASPDAGYAEERIAALVGGIDRSVIEALADAAPGPDSADCLRATLGVQPGDQAPDWVDDCRPLPKRIGILLPRSGKLAALADAQFAAAVAAVTVLGQVRPVVVLWRDSGSTPTSAQNAARSIVADGAEVIVGPVGGGNVRAALEAAGDDRFLLPGEASGQARGVAPSLEERAGALLRTAVDLGAGREQIVVLVPENGYGRRVRSALKSNDLSSGKSLIFIEYSSSTTSFSPILRPALESLRKGAPMIIADALPRTELIVRQIRREGLRVAGGGVDRDGPQVLVLSMGEGLSPSRIGKKHESLDGVILAPVAAPDADSRGFEDQYRAQQGRAPDDQALLVWRALSAAWSGASGTVEPEPTLVRIKGAAVVAL